MARFWTTKEEDYLREHYGKESWKSLTKDLNRGIGSIKNKAFKMGLNIDLDIDDCYYSMKDVREILGANSYQVKKWIDKGLLKADMVNHSNNNIKTRYKYRCYPNQLVDFLFRHPELRCHFKVDAFQLDMLMLNYTGSRKKARLEKLKQDLINEAG